MSNYAVCKVSGKQYKILPNIPLLVDYLGDEKKVEVDALLISEGGKLEIGKPSLKDKITLEVKENVLGGKVRVSKFHAKANFRRTTGIRPKYSKVIWKVSL